MYCSKYTLQEFLFLLDGEMRHLMLSGLSFENQVELYRFIFAEEDRRIRTEREFA